MGEAADALVSLSWDPSTAIFTDCYCEENVWKLIESAHSQHVCLDDLVAVFVSNQRQLVFFARHRSPEMSQDQQDEESVRFYAKWDECFGPGTVGWDYHVFLVDSRAGAVIDPSACPAYMPRVVSLSHYLSYVLVQDVEPQLLPHLRKEYHVVPAGEFLANFASDRSHMRCPTTGKWLKPPPPYPALIPSAPASTHLRLADLLRFPSIFASCAIQSTPHLDDGDDDDHDGSEGDGSHGVGSEGEGAGACAGSGVGAAGHVDGTGAVTLASSVSVSGTSQVVYCGSTRAFAMYINSLVDKCRAEYGQHV